MERQAHVQYVSNSPYDIKLQNLIQPPRRLLNRCLQTPWPPIFPAYRVRFQDRPLRFAVAKNTAHVSLFNHFPFPTNAFKPYLPSGVREKRKKTLIPCKKSPVRCDYLISTTVRLDVVLSFQQLSRIRPHLEKQVPKVIKVIKESLLHHFDYLEV